MIVCFYDKDFKGLQNNASLIIDKNSYKLIRRPVKLNEFSCVCEPFTEDMQPTFLVVKNDLGKYIYGSLAGIPLLNKQNKTEINGTDLKCLLNSDVILEPTTYTSVNAYLNYIFNEWKTQVNQSSVTCELVYSSEAETIALSDLIPTTEKKIYNAYEELSNYLNFYNLYIETKLDLVNKKVIFTVGKTMQKELKVKLWEYGIKDYGKWVANINETQGYYNWTPGTKWILTKDNNITSNVNNRDIYPIKRKVINSTTSLAEANKEALTLLLDSLFNENIDLNTNKLEADFKTKFAIYVKKSGGLYKNLPCGELEYNSNGLKRIQIGYRYSDINYI